MLVRFFTADAAARAYLELLEREGSPKGARLTVSAGRSFAASCPACGGLQRILGAPRGGERVPRCARCGARWPHEDVEVPAGLVMGGRKVGARERQLANVATLGVLVGKLKTWERRVLLLYATRAYSLEALTEECARRWPRRLDGWSLYRVRSDLRDARQALERQLRRAGMLEGALLSPGG